jgi:protein-S-isoprenylcysteine O-methyltransferase Ste14
MLSVASAAISLPICGCFFYWVANGCPSRWPGIGVPFSLAVDVVLLAIFFALHTLTAGIDRSKYLAVCAASIVLLISFWQPFNGDFWRRGWPELSWWKWVNLGLFAAGHTVIIANIGMAKFFGLEDSSSKDLKTSGIYSIVRHPMNTNLLLFLVLTPVMSYERFLVVALTAAYLWIALPIEERRLIKVFTWRYEDYRDHVPALIPFWRNSHRHEPAPPSRLAAACEAEAPRP